MGPLRCAEGQSTWECALPPAPSQKGLSRGKDKTPKNVKCGDSTLLHSCIRARTFWAQELTRDGAEVGVPFRTC